MTLGGVRVLGAGTKAVPGMIRGLSLKWCRKFKVTDVRSCQVSKKYLRKTNDFRYTKRKIPSLRSYVLFKLMWLFCMLSRFSQKLGIMIVTKMPAVLAAENKFHVCLTVATITPSGEARCASPSGTQGRVPWAGGEDESSVSSYLSG